MLRSFLYIAILVICPIQILSQELFIFSLNDFHGHIQERKNVPGIAKLITSLEQYKDANHIDKKNSVLVLAGDNYQGSFLSNITLGSATSAFFKSMKIPVSAVGNHEFDWGTKHFKRWQREGGFNFIASNIYNNKDQLLFSPYKILRIGDYKIALVGCSTQETVYSVVASKLEGIKFKAFAEVLPSLVQHIKAKEKPDFIIALSHVSAVQESSKTAGINTQELQEIASVPGIDAIITAHSHQSVASYVNQKPVVQGCYYGRCFGVLKIDTDTHSIIPLVHDVMAEKDHLIPDKKAAAMVEKYLQKYSKEMETTIAVATHDIDLKGMADFMTKNILKAYQAQGIDFVILNGGFFRLPILHKGNIQLSHVYELMPFDNTLCFLEISGSDLKKAMHHSKYVLKDNKIGFFYGVHDTIDDHKIYKVAISEFMYPNGDLYDFHNAKNFINTGVLLRDLFIDFLAKTKQID